MTLFRRLFLLSLVGGIAFGQSRPNYTGAVTNEIHIMTTNFAPQFLSEANALFRGIAIVTLVILGLKIARASANAHGLVFPLDEITQWCFRWCIVALCLRYWSAPSAMLGGFSVSTVIPNIAYDLAGKISLTALDTLLDNIDTVMKDPSLVPANPLAVLHVLTYFEFTGLMLIMEGILFCLTLLGFVAIGLGTLVGPLMVPWLMVARFEWLFFNWISFTIKYSFYQVIANGLVFIWANAFNFVFTNVFGGSISLAKASTELLALFLLTAGMAASIFFVTHWANDLFSGSSHAGGSLAGSVGGAVKKAIKKGRGK